MIEICLELDGWLPPGEIGGNQRFMFEKGYLAHSAASDPVKETGHWEGREWMVAHPEIDYPLLGALEVSYYFYTRSRRDTDGMVYAMKFFLDGLEVRKGRKKWGCGLIGDDFQVADLHGHRRVGDDKTVIIIKEKE